MSAGVIGFIGTPAQGNKRPDGAPACLDNGAFNPGFNVERWWRWLQRRAVHADSYLFATAPDAVADHQRSYRRADPWLDPMRDLGYRGAWVAQNGATLRPGSVPWSRFDCLFIGGDTDWKLGGTARALIDEGKARGKWVHMGRVNTGERYRYAERVGCDSADGTTLAQYPSTIDDVLTWVLGKPAPTGQLSFLPDPYEGLPA